MLSKFSESELAHMAMWTVGFVGVCVLVGIGKVKAETLEMMLFAIGGAVMARKGASGE